MARRKRKDHDAFSEMPPDYARDSDVSSFDNMKVLAYSGIFVVFAVAISLNDFKEMWAPPSAPSAYPIYIARIILFAELVVLALRFVVATHHELHMWVRWLKNPVQKQEVYASIFAIALVLGLSLAFPHKIVFLTGFITVSFLLLYWSQWLANDHLDRALRKTREQHLSSAKAEVLNAMEHYWLKRPQLARMATLMFFSSIAFSFAFAGAVQPNPQKSEFQLIAYTVLILDILVGEVVITWWRHKLEQAIEVATRS